jgi:predicted ATPase
VFQSLLDRVLTDPKEDAKAWSKRIRVALGQQFPIFHSLLSHEYQRLLMMGEPPPTVEQIDWANFIPAFKGWAKRLIQIFAIESRPLVCVIDDLQWMRQDEVSIWRALLEGSHPINHVLLVSLYRTEGSIAPPMSDLLSAHSTTLHIERLPETGVSDFIQSCLPTTVDGLGILASFLFEETQGSPLYLRSLMVSLVRDGVIYFDFDVLFWRFDPLALPAHLSDNGVDAYLEKMQQKLPAATRDALQLLACLPVSGCRLELLAELTKCSEEAVVSRLSPAQGIGAIIIGGNHVRFAHDRPRVSGPRAHTLWQRVY